MHPTGFDTIIYSDVDGTSLQARFLAILQQRWPNAILDVEGSNGVDHIEAFLARDQGMLYHHDEHGYANDHTGESCIYLISNRYKEWFNKGQTGPQQTEMGLWSEGGSALFAFSIVWQHTLVTSDDPQDGDAFSVWVMEAFLDALGVREGPLRR